MGNVYMDTPVQFNHTHFLFYRLIFLHTPVQKQTLKKNVSTNFALLSLHTPVHCPSCHALSLVFHEYQQHLTKNMTGWAKSMWIPLSNLIIPIFYFID